MRIRFAVSATLALASAFFAVMSIGAPAQAQRPGEHPGGGERHDDVHANHGHIPAPPAQRDVHAKPEIDRRPGGRVNSIPHVHEDHWYGHDRPSDKRYVIAHPYPHGRFEHFGPSYRYHVDRFDLGAHRFWFAGGFSFEIASWDWELASSWCWDCPGDNFVVYDDPDHAGWYLVYNAQTGVYVHAEYLGL
jgi:hypothetical protein